MKHETALIWLRQLRSMAFIFIVVAWMKLLDKRTEFTEIDVMTLGAVTALVIYKMIETWQKI